jgi:hypothetical protein
LSKQFDHPVEQPLGCGEVSDWRDRLFEQRVADGDDVRVGVSGYPTPVAGAR